MGKLLNIKSVRKETDSIAYVFVDGKFIASASAAKKDLAKLEAAKIALDTLAPLLPPTSMRPSITDMQLRAKQKLNELCQNKKWPKPEYRILLEEDAKPVRQPQGRLNPQLMGVVKKKDTKLLQTGLIYSNSDSTWVGPIHVVPEKYGITMVKNEKDKLTLIQDRSGSHNLVVDHLSRIEKGKDNIPIQDDFSNEVLLAFLPP
ncbi:hypothetical protein VIGAN_UM118900 [Vigna angularis var. angularis]|uniref:DRBM domain-containing protein n=1 Tax=Vigna angularis var. angularis TaxID=157739 RepID=A0A0S3TEW4_PHAAN|nr:hypothetical protein VIGAN_UM118900 [Vigna angularis var. angularis]